MTRDEKRDAGDPVGVRGCGRLISSAGDRLPRHRAVAGPGATGRYLTVDRWESAEAFERFKAGFAGEYAELDRRCQRLALTERSIGQFDNLDAT